MIKKVLVIMLLFMLPLVSATIQIKKTVIADSIIQEINNTAIINYELTNLGETDDFQFYSTVGARFDPSDYFTINSGETKNIQVKVYLAPDLMQKSYTYSFQYKIQGKKSGVQNDELVLRIFRFNEVFEINSYNIALDAESAIVYFKNLAQYDFPEIRADIHSAFFDFSRNFALAPLEKKEFTIELNREVVKKLVAGDYALTAEVKSGSLAGKTESYFKFIEKSNILSTSSISGIIMRTTKIEKINEGNLPVVVQVKMSKNIISRLFTTFNLEPSSVERTGFFVNYIFQKEVKPDENYTIKATTNWSYPLVLVLLLALIAYLVKYYSSSDLEITKQAHFIKTKGGEFALKVNVIVKSRKYIERIKVIDRLPPMVKLFDKFSSISPSRVDEANKRLEWNLESLQENEERVLSYIIFSKIGVVGRFELPQATGIFERDGKIHETLSNRVFFLTDTPKSI